MDKKRILFAMVEAGGGHKSPALAVKSAIEKKHAGEYDIIVSDLIKEVGCTDLDKNLKESWDFLLAHHRLCVGAYFIMNLMSPVTRFWEKQYLKPLYLPLLKYLKEKKPDIIFSSHYFTSFAIDHVRRKYNLDIKLINFDSDPFDIHVFWVLKGVDKYITCSKETKDQLIREGVDKEKLFVFEYPLNVNFLEIKRTKEAIGKELGLDERKKTLLISFGGQGVGGLDIFIDSIIKEKLDLNVVIVCGKNAKLKALLEKKYSDKTANTKIISLGFMTNMNELMSAADFCFIKPGAATTFEVLNLKKPIIFYASGGPNENGNIRYVLRNKLGFYAGKNAKKLAWCIKEMLNSEGYSLLISNFDKAKISNGSEEIAEFLIEYLNKT